LGNLPVDTYTTRGNDFLFLFERSDDAGLQCAVFLGHLENA